MEQLTGFRHGATPARHDQEFRASPVRSTGRQGQPSLISLNGRTLWNGLAMVALFLWVMHLIVVASLLADSPMPGRNRFHLDVEGNLPTFFSSSILMLSALFLALIAVLKNGEQDRFRFHWAAMALIFFMLSVDEAASFHEVLIEPLRRAGVGETGYLRFPWVLAGSAFVLVFVCAYSRFLLALPRPVAGMFLLSGAVFVTGAIGFEMVGGSVFDETNMNTPEYLAAMTVEEMLEMIGILLFIRTLLAYLRARGASFSLRVL